MCPSERSNHNRSMFTRPRLIIALQFLHLQFLLDLVMSLLCSFSGTIAGIRGTLLNGVASLLSLVTGLLLSSGSTDTQLVHDPLGTLLQLDPESTLGSGGAVLEVVSLVASPRDELVLGGSLWDIESIGIEIVFELRLRPGVENRILCGIGLLSQVRCDRGI